MSKQRIKNKIKKLHDQVKNYYPGVIGLLHRQIADFKEQNRYLEARCDEMHRINERLCSIIRRLGYGGIEIDVLEDKIAQFKAVETAIKIKIMDEPRDLDLG